MKVFLVRHGDADADIPEGLGDEARALTAKARQAMAQHFAALLPRLGNVDLVFTSPLVRCVQTAQILSLTMGYEGPLKAHRSLLPDMPVGALDSLVRHHTGQSLVLVGHNPTMGALASHLLGMQSFPKPVNPGTVIGMERDEASPTGPLKFLFFAPPGQSPLESI